MEPSFKNDPLWTYLQDEYRASCYSDKEIKKEIEKRETELRAMISGMKKLTAILKSLPKTINTVEEFNSITPNKNMPS
jgi:hypothetical protein